MYNIQPYYRILFFLIIGILFIQGVRADEGERVLLSPLEAPAELASEALEAEGFLRRALAGSTFFAPTDESFHDALYEEMRLRLSGYTEGDEISLPEPI